MKRTVAIFFFLFFPLAFPCCSTEKVGFFEKYLGTYACYDQRFCNFHDEFKDYPNLNLRLNEKGKMIGEFRCVETFNKSIGTAGKGYFKVFVKNLDLKQNGKISFKICKRILYSAPVGWNENGGKVVAVSFDECFFTGYFSGDNLLLQCKGKMCLADKMLFKRVYP